MLVLSRYKDESIIIDGNIEVMIVAVRGNKVQLGITAPKEISVHRKEVYEAIQREKRAEINQYERRTLKRRNFPHFVHDCSLDSSDYRAKKL